MRRKSAGDAMKDDSVSSRSRRFGRNRSKSAPNVSNQDDYMTIKGIMKFKTLDESLHSTYGGADDNSNNNADNGTNSNGKQRIQFKHIEVREYARTVGDNPSCSSGPPVTISWEYNPNTKVLSVEEYEDSRPTRRTMSQMILPRSMRTDMLRKEWNVSQQQIASAVRQGIKAKSQRRTTLGNLGKTDKVEEMIEGATKQLLRSLFLRKSVSRSIQEMDDKMKQANQKRNQYKLTQNMQDEYLEGDDEDDDHNAGIIKEPASAMPGTPTPSENMDNSDKNMDDLDDMMPTKNGSKMVTSTSSSNSAADHKDNQPKKPSRRPMADDSNHGGADDTQQESGESASQTENHRNNKKPVITAVEPDDGVGMNVSPATPAINIEC